MAEWRRAGVADAEPLTDLERDANLAALAHVFPPERFPFPWAAVRDRWDATLADPGVTVDVVHGREGLLAFVAYDAETLRHLAVHPDHWGTGLARAGLRRASSAGVRRLWCLARNERALGVYRRLGWRETGGTRTAEWPPHPTEVEMVTGS